MPFLKAEWRKLALANYVVDPSMLKAFVPPKTELDLWNGNCYVSLVGFMFLNTRLLGISIPFHRNFEEVNLRFYVRHKAGNDWRRGVVFIKEIVPKPALTLVANTIYKEHYQTMKMDHFWDETKSFREVTYRWGLKELDNHISIKADLNAALISSGSEMEFITEHYWGYTKANEHISYEYEVTHPRWMCYEMKEYDIQVDFGRIYGEAFSELADLTPTSVMLAEGSEITVENKRKL